jgi:ABC-type transporter Mla MlaB component
MLERIATALDFPTDFFFSEIAHQDVESTQRMEPTSQSADSDISAIQADITVIEMLDTARLAALRTIISDIRKQVESEHRTRRKPEH